MIINSKYTLIKKFTKFRTARFYSRKLIFVFGTRFSDFFLIYWLIILYTLNNYILCLKKEHVETTNGNWGAISNERSLQRFRSLFPPSMCHGQFLTTPRVITKTHIINCLCI